MPASVLAEHGDWIIGRNANEGQIAGLLRAIQRNGEAVAVDNRRRRWGAEALRQVVPWPSRRFIVAGENRSIDEHIAFDTLYAGFFQRRHHVANILPLERRVAAEAGDQIPFQHTAVQRAFGFQRGGEAKIGPQLQQRRQRGDDLCVLAGSAIC